MARMHHLQKYILVFLLAGSALAFNPWLTTDVFEFPKLLVLIFGVGALTIVNIFDFYFFGIENLKLQKPPVEFLFILLMFSAQILAFVFSTDSRVSLIGADMRFQGFLTGLHYILLFINSFYFFLRHSAEKTRCIFNWLLIILFTAVALALAPYILPRAFPFYIFTPAFFNNRIIGTFGNPNYLAAFLAAFLPFLVFNKNLKSFIFWPFLIIVLIALFLTGSRSAWIASVLAFLFFGVFNIVKKNNYKILAVALAAVFIIALASNIKNYLSPLMPQFERLSLDTERSTSIKTRFYLWGAGLRMFMDRPFTGFGQDMISRNIEPYLPEYLKLNDIFFIDRTHSEFIDILVTQGVFAVIGYIGFIVMILWKSARNLVYINEPHFAAAVAGFISLSAVHALNFSTISSNVLFYFLGGYLMSVLYLRANLRL